MSQSPAEQPAQSPRTVSRGLNLQLVFLGLDSLYLVFEYPHVDVYAFWSSLVADAHEADLNKGILVDDLVIKRGGLGYKLSVWDGDARLFMTDQVNDTLRGTPQEGKGMGLMLQLGPKWLRRFGSVLLENRFRQNIFGQMAIFAAPRAEEYPARINRMDIAADLLDLPVFSLSLDEWRSGWVGYARSKTFHDASTTGLLEGFSIGSSEGAIRFKVYDKWAEVNRRGTRSFWCSVWRLDADQEHTVARFEWSIKCYQARFADMRYLSDFTFERYLEVLNYAYLKWSRLCVPDLTDGNPSRWPLAPIWQDLQFLIEDWSLNFEGFARREYDYSPDITKTYLQAAAGWMAGLMARAGLERGKSGPASLADVLALLEEEGLSLPDKAVEKWQLLSRLSGADYDDDLPTA